jgi:hypothetical protein
MTNERTLISMTMMIVMIMITSDVKVTVKVNLNKKITVQLEFFEVGISVTAKITYDIISKSTVNIVVNIKSYHIHHQSDIFHSRWSIR